MFKKGKFVQTECNVTPRGGWVGMGWVTAWKDKVSPRSEKTAYGKTR